MAARTSFVGKPLACAGRVGPRATQVACRSVTRAQVAEVSELQAPRGGWVGSGRARETGDPNPLLRVRPSALYAAACLSLSLSLSLSIPKSQTRFDSRADDADAFSSTSRLPC